MRLGCLEHDPARAAAMPLARLGAVPPPLRIPLPDWQPDGYDNDTNPTCTVCALAHSARAWSWKFGGTDVQVPVSAIDALYSRATGVPLAGIAASDGADPLQVVATAQADGWDIGGQAPLVPASRVTSARQLDIARAIDRAGVAMLALTLTEGDMEAVQAGREWTLDYAPGPVAGGHMAAMGAYDGLGPLYAAHIATWGRWQAASWEWVQDRIRLVLVAGWRQLLGPAQVAAYDALWSAAAAAA